MERATLSAATGALKPVLEKLAAFLGDERTLPEGSNRADIELIKSQLERLHSVLPTIWGREDLDAPCKDWMMEARELSYDMEGDIDDFINQRTSQIPLEELKVRVSDVLGRSGEMCRMAETISKSSKPLVDPRSRFLHKDASELVGMNKLMDDLVQLVVGKLGGKTGHEIKTERRGLKKKIVLKVQMRNDRDRSKAMAVVASVAGVYSVALAGEFKDQVVVIGAGVDDIRLVKALRKKVGPAQLVQPTEEATADLDRPTATQFAEMKMVCILGFAGAGKTALAELVYCAAEEKFDCRAFVWVSPNPNVTEILKAILTGVTNAPYAGTEAPGEQYLINEISKFLADKRYLVIIDDIWHFEELDIIKKSLPKNTRGSRIIITTRINAIAEKYRSDGINDALVFKTGVLDSGDARRISEMAVNKSVSRHTAGITDNYPWYDISEMCYGMPLAIICISSALVEQIESLDGELKYMKALRRVEDEILTIPSMKPLADSLCLGYNDLPLHLRTFLLYCSIYSWCHKFEKDRLVRRWIAERFVFEKETAEGYFGDLVDSEWIKPEASGKYEIHPVMLAFLKCKSREDNLVTCLDFLSDISSPKKIRRLSLHIQEGQSLDISRMDLSHTRSLTVFGSAFAVPLKHFERLRVLELEDVKDLQNAHLVDICGLLWLRHLGLQGVLITELPPQIARLQHLESLDIRGTGVTELPWEAGQLQKSLRVLAGDINCCNVIQLPEGVSQDLQNGIPESSLAECKVDLSILVYDLFIFGTAPAEVAVFKVPGRRMHVPELIKEHFKVLSSLDIRLCKLDQDDLKFLQEMPNLKTLVLRFEVVPVEPVTIGAVGFTKLERFCVDSRVPRVIFVPGAMPKVTHLAFKFYAGPESKDPIGITNLLSLEVVVFRCSPWYSSDSPGISATIAIVRGEAREHPNQITLYINDKEEIFPVKQSAQVCGDAGSSGTGKVEPQADKLSVSVSRNSIAASNDAIASCSQTSEIEEVEAQWYSGTSY